MRRLGGRCRLGRGGIRLGLEGGLGLEVVGMGLDGVGVGGVVVVGLGGLEGILSSFLSFGWVVGVSCGREKEVVVWYGVDGERDGVSHVDGGKKQE